MQKTNIRKKVRSRGFKKQNFFSWKRKKDKVFIFSLRDINMPQPNSTSESVGGKCVQKGEKNTIS